MESIRGETVPSQKPPPPACCKSKSKYCYRLNAEKAGVTSEQYTDGMGGYINNII
jgi:hypothetical protein